MDDDATGPRPPQHRALKLTGLRTGDATEIYDGDTVSGERFVDADFSGRDLRQTSLSDSELVRCRFDDADLGRLHLVGCRLSELDVAAFAAPRCELRQVELTASRLGAIEAYESTWRSVLVTDSKVGYLNARAARWQDITFRDCMIAELDLAGARVERARFERCRVDEVHLGGDARLSDVDLREANLSAIGRIGRVGRVHDHGWATRSAGAATGGAPGNLGQLSSGATSRPAKVRKAAGSWP